MLLTDNRVMQQSRIIVLLIIIIAIAVFLVKVLAQIFVGLIILTVDVGVGFWLYGKMKTRI